MDSPQFHIVSPLIHFVLFPTISIIIFSFCAPPKLFVSQPVVHQFYQTRVIDEFVLRGNAATLKCLVPSFVADFIDVEAWLDEEGVEIVRPLADESMGIPLIALN